MSTFDYKSYCVTVETDAARYFPQQTEEVRGVYSVWLSNDGKPGRQIYRGHTNRTFKSADESAIIAAAEDAARAWIDMNAGKPWA